MAITWTLKIHLGDSVRVLTLMEAAFDNPEELMNDVLLVMLRSTQLNFDASGRPEKWDKLALITVRRRARRELGLGKGVRLTDEQLAAAAASIQILRDTGLLWQSVGGGASGAFETADGFASADATGAVIGTNRPGWQNQYPDTRGTRPAREFVAFHEQDVADILDMSMHFFLRTGPYAA